MSGGTASLPSKTLSVLGYSVEVCGRDSDPYFADLDHRGAEFFLFVHLLEAIAKPGGVFMDVGANIGATLALAQRIMRPGIAIAIEPAPLAYACLQQTSRRVAQDGETILLNSCAGAAAGFAAFEQDPFLAGSHVRDDGDGPRGRSFQMPVAALDDIVRDNGLEALDLVKIDVEGFETDVLLGMADSIARFKPVIFAEFNIFAIAAWRNESPRRFLDHVRRTFGAMYYTDLSDCLVKVMGVEGFRHFLHETITLKAGVRDVIFTNDPRGVRRLDDLCRQRSKLATV